MTKGKMGDASPIRKAFVAFRTALVTNPIVVMSFERRVDPDACDVLVKEFGKYLSVSIVALPHGEFNLSDAFYETGTITVKVSEDSYRSYDSIGAYADSLDVGEWDYLDSSHWLSVLAELFCSSFTDENIPFPAKEELERMFLTGDNYAEMQKALRMAFLAAQEMDKLEDILLDIMGDYHEKFVEYSAKKLVEDGPEKDAEPEVKRIYSMLPFEIVSHVSVGCVLDSLLPIILASGASIDMEKLFCERIERGRVFLKEFVGADFDEEESVSALAKAIKEKSKELQPLLPEYLADELNDTISCVKLASYLNFAALSDIPLEACASED
jgi:hypothetical protein